MLIVSFSDPFCVFNTCNVVASKQEAGEAVAHSNHGDEEQLTALWKQHERLYDVSSALKNAAVAKSCLSVAVKNLHQVHDGK